MAKYQRFVLKMESPWSHPGQAVKHWQNVFNLSGSVSLLAGEMEATALDLFKPIQMLTTAQTSLIHWVYYPIGSNIKGGEQTYAPGTHPGNQTGYTNPASTYTSMLEVAALCRSPGNLNSRGKRVYLRKWVHDVIHDAGNANQLAGLATGAGDPMHIWNSGAGPKLLVPCDPDDGFIGGPWTVELPLRTHQIRRGVKRKAAPASTVFVPVPVP